MIQRGTKRRRAGDFPPPEEVEDWAALGKLPLHMIAKSLNAIDHVRFRSICMSWRSSSAKRAKIPLLIWTSHDETTNYTRRIEIIDIVTKEIIPPRSLADITMADLLRRDCVYLGYSIGWLAFAVDTPEETIILINPFTAAEVELPLWTKLFYLAGLCGHLVLSGSPAHLKQHPTMAVYHCSKRWLMFHKIGEKEWKRIDLHTSLHEIICCNGRFYGHDGNLLFRIDLMGKNGSGEVLPVVLDLPEIFCGLNPRWEFLVDISGDLVIACTLPETKRYYGFLKVNFDYRKLLLLRNMDEHLFFVSKDYNLVIPSERSLGFRPDEFVPSSEVPNVIKVEFAFDSRRGRRHCWMTPDLNEIMVFEKQQKLMKILSKGKQPLRSE